MLFEVLEEREYPGFILMLSFTLTRLTVTTCNTVDSPNTCFDPFSSVTLCSCQVSGINSIINSRHSSSWGWNMMMSSRGHTGVTQCRWQLFLTVSVENNTILICITSSKQEELWSFNTPNLLIIGYLNAVGLEEQLIIRIIWGKKVMHP